VVHGMTFPVTYWIGNGVDSLQVSRDSLSGNILVRHDNLPLMTLDLSGPVAAALARDSTGAKSSVTLKEPVMVEGEANGYRVRVVMVSFHGDRRDGAFKVKGGEGFVMVSGLKPIR
ncbi:MAG TPA: hypothetical protein VFU23_04745, partial [Gemmatimonadales bacterium]|nr:hypothetical protein [Gemmatimonadales bacterium]